MIDATLSTEQIVQHAESMLLKSDTELQSVVDLKPTVDSVEELRGCYISFINNYKGIAK